MSENMNENMNPDNTANNELDQRIAAADPAAELSTPHDSLIHRAIQQAEQGKPARKTSRFFKPKTRRALIGGLSSVGALAVALSFASTSLLGLAPSGNQYLFSLAGAGAGGSQKMSAGAAASSDASTTEMGLCVGADGGPCGTGPSQFVYTAGAGLSGEAKSASIYKLVPKRSANELLTVLAATFGLTGTSRQYDTPDSTWQTLYKGQNPDGSEGYGKPQITVNLDTKAPLPQWSYQGPQPLYTDCAHSADAAKGLDVPLVDPAVQDPSKDSCMAEVSGRGPTASEALSQAKKVFKALGYNSGTNLGSLRNGDLFLEAPQDSNSQRAGISITGYLVVEGQLTSMAMSIGWSGSSSEVSYGYGFDATAESQGDFKTISAKDAVDRLGDWKWFGNPYLDYQNLKYSTVMNPVMSIDPGFGVVAGDTGNTTTGSSTGAGSSADTGAGTGVTAPDAGVAVPSDTSVSGATPTTAPPIEITVTRAQSSLMTVYAADGSIWFVPGFVFYDATGYVGNVLSIVEGVIELPKITPLTDVMVR